MHAGRVDMFVWKCQFAAVVMVIFVLLRVASVLSENAAREITQLGDRSDPTASLSVGDVLRFR
jgi:hypothetical protein